MTEADSHSELRIGSPPAPGKLFLVEAFLNTCSQELAFEDFASEKSTQAWLEFAGLWSGSKQLTSGQHRKVVEFRDSLRAWIIDSEASGPLNSIASNVTLQTRFLDCGSVQLNPAGDAYHHLVGILTQLIFNSQQKGTWERFKCCELPSCGWAFYDSTRSRTKRWCSMKTCGSRHKAREYYKRKQQE